MVEERGREQCLRESAKGRWLGEETVEVSNENHERYWQMEHTERMGCGKKLMHEAEAGEVADGGLGK